MMRPPESVPATRRRTLPYVGYIYLPAIQRRPNPHVGERRVNNGNGVPVIASSFAAVWSVTARKFGYGAVSGGPTPEAVRKRS
jgi:hypothetical protein